MSKQSLPHPCQGASVTNQNFMSFDRILYAPWESIFALTELQPQLIQNARKRSFQDPITARKTALGSSNSATMRGIGTPKVQIQREKVPKSRTSQKLTDKITSLQKLVSPYGKTDTASVLLEAFISIQALQNQIQNMLHMQFENPQTYKRGEEEVAGLRSKGLCLVPLIFGGE